MFGACNEQTLELGYISLDEYGLDVKELCTGVNIGCYYSGVIYAQTA